MQITALETIQVAAYPNLLLVRVLTDQGHCGLGETFFGAAEVAAYLHATAAPRLIGQDPRRIERLRLDLQNYLGTRGTGAEQRGNSALDIALWDLLGRSTDQPIYQLLGGATRASLPAYNTCAGSAYAAGSSVVKGAAAGPRPPEGPYEDLDAWVNGRAGELALSLQAEGLEGMKIWPFDRFAYASGGREISPTQLDQGLEPFRQARVAAGPDFKLMVELHGLWSLPCALKIARAFEREGLDPYWIEDPLRPDDLASLAHFAHATPIWTAASELLGGRQAYRELLEARAASIVIMDLSWGGGLTEAKAVAGMAEAFGLPFTAHDCTGPIVWAASVQLGVNLPNTPIQEVTRASYAGWYAELATGLPVVEQGLVRPAPGPGHGVSLRPEFFDRPDLVVRRTGAAG